LDDITPANTKQTGAIKLLSRDEVLARVPVSYVTIYHWMKAGTFPRSRLINGGPRVGWIESEIDAWVGAQPKQKLKGD
jgi:predicted DNA-binding transcriptional regulator AlpA